MVFSRKERDLLAEAGIHGPADMDCDPQGWRGRYEALRRLKLPEHAVSAPESLTEPYKGKLVRYLDKAIDKALSDLEDAPEGSRNTTLGEVGLAIHGLLKGAAHVGLDEDTRDRIEEDAFDRYVEIGVGMDQAEPPEQRWERTRADAEPRNLSGVIAGPEDDFEDRREADDLIAELKAAIDDPGRVQDKKAVIEQCAKLRHLDPLEYDPLRKPLTKALELQAKTFDSAVNNAAKRLGLSDGGVAEAVEGALSIPSREPCSQPVKGGALVDEITATIRRHVVIDEDAARAAALWSMFTYAHDTGRHCPLLAIQAPTKGAGKTTMLDVIGQLVEKPLPAVNASEASIFRAVAKWEPTLLVDEADTWIAHSEELRGLFNAGFGPRSQAYVLRCVGDDHEVQQFPAWCPKALAGIGKLPDTIQDRSIPNLPQVSLKGPVELNLHS